MTYSNTYSSPSSPTNFNPFSGMGMRKGGRPSLFPGSGDGSTLSLDFTTGVLDPRLTFSRASTATFVNSSGYVEYAAHNLYYNTNFATITTGTSNPSLTSKGWSYVFSTGTAVFNTDGSVSMTAVSNRVGLLRSSGFAGTGRRLIFSVDITSVGDTGLPPSQLVNEGTKTNDAYYIDGTLWTSGNVVGPCTVSFVFTSNPSGNAATYFGIGMSSASTGIVTFANPRWGFYGGVNQIAYSPNTSATNANYLTAEYNAPRFDYSPTNIGEPRGLLIEGQTPNITLYSEKLNQSVTNVPWYYANLNTPTVATGIADPYGNTTGTTAWKLVATGTGYHAARQTWTFTAVAYTFSFYAKAAEYDRVTIGDLTSGQGGCLFVLTGNGTATVRGGGTGSPRDPQITPYGTTGWYRCSFTMTMTATAVGMGIVGYPAAATPDAFGASYTADGTSGVYVTMVQVELGSGASSYIPTGASQVTRNAEYCQSTVASGIASWLTSLTTSTYFVDFVPMTQRGSFANTWNTRTSTFQGYEIYCFDGTAGVNLTCTTKISASPNVETNVATGLALNSRHKLAYSIDATSGLRSVNGSTVSAANPVALPTGTPSTFGVGSGGGGSGTSINAWIRSIKYYPTALTQTEINALTAP